MGKFGTTIRQDHKPNPCFRLIYTEQVDVEHHNNNGDDNNNYPIMVMVRIVLVGALPADVNT